MTTIFNKQALTLINALMVTPGPNYYNDKRFPAIDNIPSVVLNPSNEPYRDYNVTTQVYVGNPTLTDLADVEGIAKSIAIEGVDINTIGSKTVNASFMIGETGDIEHMEIEHIGGLNIFAFTIEDGRVGMDYHPSPNQEINDWAAEVMGRIDGSLANNQMIKTIFKALTTKPEADTE